MNPRVASASVVLFIPELLEDIQIYLTPHDLVQCAAVSKTFQTLFTPFLWEIIAIKTHHQHIAFTTAPEVQDALIRNAPHIRAIYLRTCKSLEPFLRVDPSHFAHLHTLAFPWALRRQDPQDQYQEPDDGVDLSYPASSVYTPPSSALQGQQQDQQLQEWRPRILYGGGDRIVGQHDWLRSNGMFPGLEQVLNIRFRHGQGLYKEQRRQAEAVQRRVDRVRQKDEHRLQWQATLQQTSQRNGQQQQYYDQQWQPRFLQPRYRQDKTNIQERQNVLKVAQLRHRMDLEQFDQQQELFNIATHKSQLLQQQPLQQQPEQKPENTRSSNHQTPTHRQSASEAEWLVQQLDNQDIREQRLFEQGLRRRQQQGRRTAGLQQDQKRLESRQTQYLQDQQRLHQSYPQNDFTWARQAELRTHDQALLEAEKQVARFKNIIRQGPLISMHDHQETQLQVDQLLQTMFSLQFSQLRMVKTEPQLYIQRHDREQLSLVHAMERLQLCIEARSRIQAYLDSVESAPAQPWFVDNAEDEQWLVRFMTRFSGLKAFGSNNLILSNKEVWDSMGRLWSDLRVLSLVLFKYATGHPPQRHLELAALLDRCPPRLESLQLSFSEQDMSLHPSSHEFARINDDVAAVGPGSVVLEDIPTLRRAYIEGHIGKMNYLQDAETWIHFLCRCPNLQSLALGSCSSQVIHRVAAKVKDHWPLLQEFATNPGPDRLAAFDTDMDECIAALLSATCDDPDKVDEADEVGDDDVDDMAPIAPADVHTPQQHREGLKKVRFDRFIFSHRTYALQSLFRMSHTLTHLSIRDCHFSDGFPNEPVLRLLRTCDRLEEVDLLPSGSYYRTKLMVCSAQQFVNLFSLKASSSPWPSAQTLKVLRVAIESFDQPSVTGGAADMYSLFSLSSSSSPSIQSSVEDLYELQREVCQILGSFTALEELSLGVHWEKDQTCSFLPRLFQQEDCLELMLKSGLDLMGGLKQLRVLNVSRMAHRIGLEEVKWMRAHWPRLHTVLGLLRVENLEYLPVDASCLASPERKARKEGSEESERRVLEWIGEHFSRLQFT